MNIVSNEAFEVYQSQENENDLFLYYDSTSNFISVINTLFWMETLVSVFYKQNRIIESIGPAPFIEDIGGKDYETVKRMKDKVKHKRDRVLIITSRED